MGFYIILVIAFIALAALGYFAIDITFAEDIMCNSNNILDREYDRRFK